MEECKTRNTSLVVPGEKASSTLSFNYYYNSMRKILVNSRRPVKLDTIVLDPSQSQDIAQRDDQRVPRSAGVSTG